jgi:hypothetical protein
MRKNHRISGGFGPVFQMTINEMKFCIKVEILQSTTRKEEVRNPVIASPYKSLQTTIIRNRRLRVGGEHNVGHEPQKLCGYKGYK